MISCRQVFARINDRDGMVTFMQVGGVEVLPCCSQVCYLLRVSVRMLRKVITVSIFYMYSLYHTMMELAS